MAGVLFHPTRRGSNTRLQMRGASAISTKHTAHQLLTARQVRQLKLLGRFVLVTSMSSGVDHMPLPIESSLDQGLTL